MTVDACSSSTRWRLSSCHLSCIRLLCQVFGSSTKLTRLRRQPNDRSLRIGLVAVLLNSLTASVFTTHVGTMQSRQRRGGCFVGFVRPVGAEEDES
uniref:Uncharacterized protein n=1 Tax=Triticum urartu TaxID=4572 RepID=A0A8R7P4B0_TRIUA